MAKVDWLGILEQAISGCGYWRWWAAKLPESVQLEFGGTLLWSPPAGPDLPPSGVEVVRLVRPSRVLFLAGNDSSMPPDWPDRMHADEFDPFTIEHDSFTLTSRSLATDCLRRAQDVRAVVGSADQPNPPVPAAGARIAFWAGPVGFFAEAEQLKVVGRDGELSPAAIVEAGER